MLEQLDLLPVGHLADVLAVAAEVRPDVRVEVGLLGRFSALARDLQGQPGLQRDRDCAVRALVRADPPEEEQVVALLGMVRIEGEVERIRDVRDPRQLRPGRALAEREGDQLRVRRHPHDLLVEVPGVPVTGPCTVWTSGVGSSDPSASPIRPVWSWITSKSPCRAKQLSACWSSQNVCPIRSLGASSKTAASFARVRESPEAKSVTS